MNPDFKTIALVGKYNRPGSTGSLLRLAHFLRKRGHEVMITAHTAETCETHEYPVATLDEMGAVVDLAAQQAQTLPLRQSA